MRHFQLNKVRHLWFFLYLVIAFSLGSCGGNDGHSESQASGEDTSNPPPEPIRRGDWKRTEFAIEHDVDAIRSADSILGPEIPTDKLQYAVKLYRIIYTTTDENGELINVSGAIALPNKNPQLASPLLSFQHGTLFYDAEAPGNDHSAGAPPVLLASLGYVVIAADYVGYGASQGTPHPYLQKVPSANAVIDLVKAARYWLAQQSVNLNQQLFLTGYSQGGYVTMAAHQVMEAANDRSLTVTASLPAAGPYHLKATLDDLTSQYSFRQYKQRLTANTPQTAQRLPPPLAEALANFIIDRIVPDNTDIVFSDNVLYAHLRTNGEATISDNVHDWRATAPVRLHHGKDDEVVPFFNASDALTAMQANNSNNVALKECLATPEANHDACIAPYGFLIEEYFGGVAQGL